MALHNHALRIIRDRCQDVEHEAGGGVGFVRVDVLADSKEPDAMQERTILAADAMAELEA